MKNAGLDEAQARVNIARKIIKEIGIQEHITHFLKNLYAWQEATIRTRQETMDWFQIGKGSLILSPCLFNLYAEFIR